ncbi:MAG: UDP-N-acetylmuramoyl-L-alanyl-D-glutamate--2,6-diaminopimelate ligase [Fimbriimonadaceae bacterium]|jgi:UDP-N-acetylmuramoyl-L-alanyl-D-glutamate--2,6-diaminopimelate ligase|nr:UDP-N-acetylmuramoyl-L-alanyl-D-glutamate--2,6-diaminopimelate ligase [Fimbriimonadaceae bacterium]
MDQVSFQDVVAQTGASWDEVSWEDNPLLNLVTADSREVKPGSLFICMPSASRDTHAFLPEVAKAGAQAALVHSREGFALAQSLGLAVVLVEPVGTRFNFALGRVCRLIFDDPSSKMKVVAVTGTNGKTTSTWMIRHALASLGQKSAYLGTLGFQIGDSLRELSNTTPFPVELWKLMDEAARAGAETLCLEASSHALFERRLAGVQFDVGLFTNLTQDHLDFHGTMENYASAKKLLFTEYAAANDKAFIAGLNREDTRGQEWARELPCRVFTFGRSEADITVEPLSVAVDSLHLSFSALGEKVEARLKVGGLFNIENATTAFTGLIALGVPVAEAAEALAEVKAVPGRFEAVPNDLGIGVIVDYAHTPDALEQLLASARELQPKRIITVFGCGGDRDRSKRPKMAKVVSELSDVSVVTSDNPRTEDPQAILADIMVGIQPGAESVQVIDRREAIREAVLMAEPGDVVVIAGKGHEDYQIIGRTKHPMDDRLMARAALQERGG